MLVQALARAGMRSENYGMKSGTWIKMANKGGSDGHKLRLKVINISGARARRTKDTSLDLKGIAGGKSWREQVITGNVIMKKTN